ncbi:protein ANTAGONIST OF LIKE HETEROCHROMATIN PROTEIN 1-like [Trematomus bernacchii]|uniref:DDE Tnp4 domain-containing protein n=1 Tax=Pagothenia borchgrevinki TaxID=8213 RepID=A0ABD2GUB2_PAGBO|nr:protein ANTAGONIST OF LIKE HETEROCHROMATIN PROTEIN 1-like [Trematomus bernacchii]
MEAADVFLPVIAWCRTRQSQDSQAEARRQKRRLKLLAFQQLRLKKLRETWRLREKVYKQSKLRRLCSHDTWMKAITHQFLRDRRQQSPKVWLHPRTSDWWENTAATFTDHEWLQHFRVSRETFSYLCTTLNPQLKRQDTNYRLCIPLEKRVALTLYKLAHPCDYRTVSDLFAVGVASVCHSVHEFCTAVIEVLKPQLVVTPNKFQLENIEECFYHTYQIPQCIGVLDSMNITISRPPHLDSEKPDRESYLAILFQAVVDDKGLFWDLSMSCPTWVNDNSGELLVCEDFSTRMHNVCRTDSSCVVIGDAGYPSKNWLLKPSTNTSWLTAEQELLNTQIIAARSVAHYAFERLKGRWRCLNRRNDCNVEIVKDMVETCCVLHNLCERNNDMCLPDWIGQEPLQTVDENPQKNSDAESLDDLQQLIQDSAE